MPNFDQKSQFLRKRLVGFSLNFQNWVAELILHLLRYLNHENRHIQCQKGVFQRNFNFLRPPWLQIDFWPAPPGFLADFDKNGVKMLGRPIRIILACPLRNLKHHPRIAHP